MTGLRRTAVIDPDVIGHGGEVPAAVDGAPLAGIARKSIGSAVAALGSNGRLVLVGLGRRAFVDALGTADDVGHCVLTLAAGESAGTATILNQLLDDLAELALERWPDWPRADDPVAPWRKAADRLAAGGRRPRFRRADPAMEFRGLRGLIDPAGLLLAAEVDPAAPRHARAMVDALEWCAARGAPTVALLPSRPPPVSPYDRLLYGARELQAEVEPVAARFVASRALPHHASVTERRVKEALDRDAELAPLFACNQTVAVAGGGRPRVDLLWREGRVVVELDGPEHQASPKFADDRHRDYELLMAGYHVLRITNDQVATDLQRAVDKIRAVVELSRRGGAPWRTS